MRRKDGEGRRGTGPRALRTLKIRGSTWTTRRRLVLQSRSETSFSPFRSSRPSSVSSVPRAATLCGAADAFVYFPRERKRDCVRSEECSPFRCPSRAAIAFIARLFRRLPSLSILLRASQCLQESRQRGLALLARK